MTRLPDWQARLSSVANARRNVAYQYGMTDCWCFARAAVEATTGVVLLPGIESPKGWLAAAKAMLSRGWSDVEDMMTALLGEPLGNPMSARAGDIVSYEFCGERHLAVCFGDEALSPQQTGLQVIGRSAWRCAWSVG